MTELAYQVETGLPEGWSARPPQTDDVAGLIALVAGHRKAMTGSGSLDPDAIRSEAVGVGSWTRRQLVVTDPTGGLAAWARLHDRAGGRTAVEVTVQDEVGDADRLASSLFGWAERSAGPMVRLRGLDHTQLDSGCYAVDERQRGWLRKAGYTCVRTWLQMSRPVPPQEAEPGVLPAPRPGVRIRRVAEHPDGLPVAADLQTVHQVLEESFADHFNSYRESFPEFIQRLREDPGHRWDHWWIATVDLAGPDGELVEQPGGAVVGTVLVPNEQGIEGSYIDYIGVHRRARGRGIAKALLNRVIMDAARRGRDRVDLEVDADSPTGADGLYRSMGWETHYRTESWHRSIDIPG